MRKPKKYILILFLAFFLINLSFGQEVAPSTPELFKVTVNSFQNIDTIIWYPSSSGNVDYYIVGLSRISNPADPYRVDSIGTVYAPDTLFVNHNTESDLKSVGYTVIAYNLVPGSRLPSGYDDPDSTIYLTATYDSCNAEVILNWNDYNTWRGNILGYGVYESVEGNTPQPIAVIIDESVTTFTVRFVSENSHLDYFIEVLHNDSIRTSRSNLAEIYTGALNSPDFITANHASETGNGNIEIFFSVDTVSQLSDYKLLRSDSPNGNFDTVSEFQSTDKSLSVIDQNRNYLSGSYFYKLVALNYCNKIVRESNAINNIILEGNNNGLVNQLSWNTIENWPGETGSGLLYRWNSTDPASLDSINITSQSSYTDDLSGYFSPGNAVNGEFCYRIKFIEMNNPYTSNNIAYSNELCLTISHDVRMPNAFIPNNPAGENNVLRPIFLIEPERYDLTIYNRWGNIIWQGSSPWDGKSEGKYVIEGVYVFYLKVYPRNEKPLEYSGHVTIMYR